MAQVTLVRLLTSVSSLVQCQVLIAGETFTADGTSEGLLTCVNTKVNFEMIFSSKHLTAHITFESLLITVPFLPSTSRRI